MLAVTGRPAEVRAQHAYEFKWDGVRTLASIDPSGLMLTSRRGGDITHRYPELAGLAEVVPDGTVLDGEIVALDQRARPSFGLLQHRMHLDDPGRIAAAVTSSPVVLMLFDLLREGGTSRLDDPYEQRRAALLALGLASEQWQTPPHGDDLDAMLRAAEELGLEGVVAKRLGSRYRPGVRSPDWRKLPLLRRQEFVVGGWVPGTGRRSGSFGALAVGYHEGSELRYAGRVGTGYRADDVRRLGELLEERERATSPFTGAQPPSETVFVEPDLVIDVQFKQWTRDGVLRAPSYKGLRNDKDPRDVVREDVPQQGS
ncbi:MAG: non-homologous end-joining DNA ligase [Actinobacteria bacterium]|nr:non-homologous end-joining DNA ligase [Actinomycetota bacterium]